MFHSAHRIFRVSYEIVTAEVAQKALPECNIVFIEGDEMKEKLSGYLCRSCLSRILSPWAAPCLTTPSTSAADFHERPPNHTGLGCTLLATPVAGGCHGH